MVLFAPLYATNECRNQCAYCGFNAKNSELQRKTLTDDELRFEAEQFKDQKRKHLLVDRLARIEQGERGLYF
ncbi:MAG: hypothetical protein AB7D07_11180 [Desulfovibrionaceae bacterium]